jgi:NADPH2:quinone reductase
MRAVVYDSPAKTADELRIGIVPTPIPRPDELLVRVTAAALNRADLLQRRGFYPPPAGASSILGLEVVGEVVQADWAAVFPDTEMPDKPRRFQKFARV